MRNINAYSKEISFDEAAERFKRIAKNNPEFINKQTINQSIDILESSTDFYRNPHRLDAALKLAETVCALLNTFLTALQTMKDYSTSVHLKMAQLTIMLLTRQLCFINCQYLL